MLENCAIFQSVRVLCNIMTLTSWLYPYLWLSYSLLLLPVFVLSYAKNAAAPVRVWKQTGGVNCSYKKKWLWDGRKYGTDWNWGLINEMWQFNEPSMRVAQFISNKESESFLFLHVALYSWLRVNIGQRELMCSYWTHCITCCYPQKH